MSLYCAMPEVGMTIRQKIKIQGFKVNAHKIYNTVDSCFPNTSTVELQWLEHLWNDENMFETGVV